MRPINVGQWEQLAHAIFGITGGNPLPDLEEQLKAVVDLGRLRPEWMYPAGILPFQTEAGTAAPVAAQFQAVSLHNPPTSGLLAVVTQVQQDSGLEENLFVTVRDGDAALGETGVDSTVGIPRDSRWIPQHAQAGHPVGLQLITRSHATRLSSSATIQLASQNTSVEWAVLPNGLWFVLGPNGLLSLESELANQGAGPARFVGYIIQLHKGKRA